MALFANAPSYGSDQTLALQAKPFSLDTPLAQAAQITAADQTNQTNAQLNPLRVAAEQEQLGQTMQLDPLRIAAAKRAEQQQDQSFGDQQIARAAALTDPNDPNAHETWDASMQALVDKGVAQAGQYVGRYTPAKRDQVVAAYATAPQSPLAAAGAMSQGGQPVTAAADASQLDIQFKNMPPAQMQATAAGLDKLKQSLIRVSQSQNPSQTWDQEAQALGHPDWVGKYSPLQLKRIWDSTVPVDDYLQARLTREGAGVPAPIVKPEIKQAGDALYDIDPQTGKATLAAGGKWTLAGTDPSTKEAVYVNTDTGEEKKGAIPLGPKPGTQSTRLSVYQLKQQAYLEAHPNDTQGALDYANGRKNMTPEQIESFAIAQATRDYQAATLGGESIPDQQAYVGQRATAISGQLHAAQGSGGAPAPAPASQAPPQSALAQLVEGQNTTFRNGQVWTKKNGKPVRVH